MIEDMLAALIWQVKKWWNVIENFCLPGVEQKELEPLLTTLCLGPNTALSWSDNFFLVLVTLASVTSFCPQ